MLAGRRSGVYTGACDRARCRSAAADRIPRVRVALLALAVGLVLADSSVVTLGLPGVLEDFDASPQAVSWVLTGYNLALALAAVPAALLVRRTSPARPAAIGLV